MQDAEGSSQHVEDIGKQPGWALWFWWVLATALGGVVGLIAARVLLNLDEIYDFTDGRPLLNFIVHLTAGAAIWVAASIGQWLVLRRHFQLSVSWILATALGGVAVTIVFAFWIPSLLSTRSIGPGDTWNNIYMSGVVLMGLGGVVAGTLIGLVQYRLLIRQITNAHWWISANAGALAVAILVGGAVDEAIIEHGRESWYAVRLDILGSGGIKPGILIIAIYGSVTGLALIWLLRKHQPSRLSQAYALGITLAAVVVTGVVLLGLSEALLSEDFNHPPIPKIIPAPIPTSDIGPVYTIPSPVLSREPIVTSVPSPSVTR